MGCAESNPDIPGNTNLEEDLEYELGGVKLPNETVERAGDVGLVTAENVTEEQFMATKPWIGALVAPTNKPAVNPNPPDRQLTLQFINGFHVEDVRQNIYWGSKPNSLIYPAAAVGVNMDVTTLKQRFMGAGDITSVKGHTDDIMALGVSPDRKWVITGSLGAQPDIILWSGETMEIKNRTKLGRNTRAVSTIRFSKDGKYIFCSDKHNDSNVYCFDTESLKPRGSEKCGSDVVIDAETGNNNRFACATKSGVWFFQYVEGQGMSKSRGIFGNNPRSAMSAITFNSTDNSFLSGSIDGFIFTWDGTSCSKVRKTHDGSVMAIHWVDGITYSSGSQDRSLKLSDSTGVVIKTYELPTYAKSIDALNKKIVVGTKCGRVITIDGDNKKELMRGHWTGQTWGVAVASDGMVYTSGDDNTILAFNPKTCRVEREGTINATPGKKYKIGGASTLSLLPPNQQARGLAVSKAGHLAIGLNDGGLSIRTTTDLNSEIYGNKTAKQWIEVIRYSPDEKRMAVGSHDNNIYIYEVNGNSYKLKGTLKGHNSFITQLDWSKDGRSMQSVCGAYELLFWNVDNLSQLTGGGTAFRDEHWATYTVKLGWWVQGVFPAYCDGSHVNGVDRTKDEKLVVTADDWGLVNIYRNPCMKGAKANSYRAHSSHVVRALLDQSDSYLYSVGGYDKTLMMWKVS